MKSVFGKLENKSHLQKLKAFYEVKKYAKNRIVSKVKNMV